MLHASDGSDAHDNVFAAMGVADADERLAKAELARAIRKEVAARGWTQAQTADAMGLKQPDVSELLRGQLTRFSITRLERCLNALDLHVRIQVGRRGPDMTRAGIEVELVESF